MSVVDPSSAAAGRPQVPMDGWYNDRARHGGADAVPLPNGGRLWLCGKHFVGPDPDAALAAVGASAVVCLNQRSELVDRYPHYVEWLRTQAPLRAVWFPIPDLGAPHLDAATELLESLCQRVERGDTLLVHCGAGIGRAGTIAAGLLMALGSGAADALALVAAHRPMAGPEAGAQRDLIAALVAP
ncbi:unannotated protein [freshwater metagenome]|uniref:Unannotated protein n=1 Tax=freshwater metagenome TaxID=449393 RepID=A0A6J7CH31_9ZZZZ|nr:hypothetical protein [Actinomycetota bacterium]